jgi:hypothetical protein
VFLKKIQSSLSHQIDNDAKDTPMLSKSEIDYWLKKFQENDNES